VSFVADSGLLELYLGNPARLKLALGPGILERGEKGGLLPVFAPPKSRTSEAAQRPSRRPPAQPPSVQNGRPPARLAGATWGSTAPTPSSRGRLLSLAGRPVAAPGPHRAQHGPAQKRAVGSELGCYATAGGPQGPAMRPGWTAVAGSPNSSRQTKQAGPAGRPDWEPI